MARVELMAGSLEELGGAAPTPGAEVVLRGVRYRVPGVTPPKRQLSPRGRPRDEVRAGRWKPSCQARGLAERRILGSAK
jgi:hypothetical protein